MGRSQARENKRNCRSKGSRGCEGVGGCSEQEGRAQWGMKEMVGSDGDCNMMEWG